MRAFSSARSSRLTCNSASSLSCRWARASADHLALGSSESPVRSTTEESESLSKLLTKSSLRAGALVFTAFDAGELAAIKFASSENFAESTESPSSGLLGVPGCRGGCSFASDEEDAGGPSVAGCWESGVLWELDEEGLSRPLPLLEATGLLVASPPRRWFAGLVAGGAARLATFLRLLPFPSFPRLGGIVNRATARDYISGYRTAPRVPLRDT